MTCIKINLDDFPHLNKIKKNELDGMMNLIFKTGYHKLLDYLPIALKTLIITVYSKQLVLVVIKNMIKI